MRSYAPASVQIVLPCPAACSYRPALGLSMRFLAVITLIVILLFLIMVAVVFGRGAAVGLISCVVGLLAGLILLLAILGSRSQSDQADVQSGTQKPAPQMSVRPIWLDK